MKKVAIVVINYKNSDLAIKLVKQFDNVFQKNIFLHFIITDNNSKDGSHKKLEKKFKNNPQVTLIKSLKNTGFAGGANTGLKHAISKRYDYALVINSDVKLTRDFLKHLLQAFKKIPNLAVAGPKIYFIKGREFHKHKYKKHQLGKVIWSAGGSIDWDNIYGQNRGIDEVDTGQYNKLDTSIDFISGCCMLIKISHLKKVGLFDPDYFMYLEDADLCTRTKKNGFKIAYIPKSVIYHYNAGSSHAGGGLQQYFLSRNRLLFAKKFAKFRTKFAIFRQSLATLLFGKYKWQKAGIIDFYLNKLEKGRWK